MVSSVATIRPEMIVTAMATKKASNNSGIMPRAVVSAAIATGRRRRVLTATRRECDGEYQGDHGEQLVPARFVPGLAQNRQHLYGSPRRVGPSCQGRQSPMPNLLEAPR